MKFFAILAAGAAALAVTACDKADAPSAAASDRTANTVAGTLASAAGTPNNPADWTTTITPTAEGGFRMGNPDAKVKIVEFGSMTCHVCRDFAKESAPAFEDKYIKSGRVSYEFRNFVRDQYDIIASLLARCQGPAPFFKLTEQIYTEQDAFIAKATAMTQADIDRLQPLATSQQFVQLAGIMGLDRFVGMRGIPAAKANACLTNQAELDRLIAMQQAAIKDFKVAGTPTFLVNGTPVTDAIQWKTLEPKIQSALGS